MPNQKKQKRAKDLPLSATIKQTPKLYLSNINVENKNQLLSPTFKINDPPMIAGQLLIYDLDETPPDDISGNNSNIQKQNYNKNFGFYFIFRIIVIFLFF